MQIENDYNQTNVKKSSNITKVLIILMILIVIAVIAIICAIMFLQKKPLTISVNGEVTQLSDDTFIFSDNGKVYISIRDIAQKLGYEAHNGEYKVDTEDTNKMYIEAVDGTETTSFYLNSTTISKVAPDTSDNYMNITIDEPIIEVNGKMYITSKGFTPAFNSLFSYNSSKNTITIQTLSYLYNYYSSIITQLGYAEIDKDFNNQKAIIYGMIVASKENTKKYGVISVTGQEIISPRYDKIEFIENSQEFIITNSSSKVGIAYSTGETKISVSYDEIKVIDSDLGLYLVKSNNKYGIVNSQEDLVIHMEYDRIGVDTTLYPTNNITNSYILYDTYIPVMQNQKWGLFNTQGQKILNTEYDDLGCIPKNIKDKVVNNTLLIEPSKIVILQNNGKYGGIDTRGNVLIPVEFDGIYSIISAGKTMYYLLYNGQEYDALEYIRLIKEQFGISDDQDQENNEQENTNTVQDENTVQDTNSVQDTNTNQDANTVGNETEVETSAEPSNETNSESLPNDSNNAPENTENNAE